MQKTTALALLGGTAATAAKCLDCSHQAVHAWPETLPRRIADRVIAARTRLEWDIAIQHAPPGTLNIPPLILDAMTV